MGRAHIEGLECGGILQVAGRLRTPSYVADIGQGRFLASAGCLAQADSRVDEALLVSLHMDYAVAEIGDLASQGEPACPAGLRSISTSVAREVSVAPLADPLASCCKVP